VQAENKPAWALRC